ncbi:hypothetical protein DICA4_D19372 [Diutina catenulata]
MDQLGYSSDDSDSSPPPAPDVAALNIFSQNHAEMLNNKKSMYFLLRWRPSADVSGKLRAAAAKCYDEVPELAKRFEFTPVTDEANKWGWHVSIHTNIHFAPHEAPKFVESLQKAMSQFQAPSSLVGVRPEAAKKHAQLTQLLGISEPLSATINVPLVAQMRLFGRRITNTSYLAVEVGEQPVFRQIMRLINEIAALHGGETAEPNENHVFHLTIANGKGKSAGQVARHLNKLSSQVSQVDISEYVKDVVIDFDELTVSTIGVAAEVTAIPLVEDGVEKGLEQDSKGEESQSEKSETKEEVTETKAPQENSHMARIHALSNISKQPVHKSVKKAKKPAKKVVKPVKPVKQVKQVKQVKKTKKPAKAKENSA